MANFVTPMTAQEEQDIRDVLGGEVSDIDAVVDFLKVAETGQEYPLGMPYQTILRMIEEYSITGEDKDKLDSYLTKYPFTEADFPFVVE